MRQVTDPLAVHGEGPVWMPELGGLAWVDMLEGDLLILDISSTRVERRHLGDVAACIRPRSGGGFIAALEHSFALYDSAGNEEAILRAFDIPGVRFNDGTCDVDGSFYCGTMAYDQTAHRGDLYRLSPAGEVSRVVSELTIANGIQFTPGSDGRFIDSPTQRVDRIVRESGRLTRAPFVHVPDEIGMPDGLCMDTDGGTWVAMWGGSTVRRYDRNGELDVVLDVPAAQVTACAFGGPSLSTLYITTSRLGLENAGPAGSLFAVDVDVAGYPPLPYGG